MAVKKSKNVTPEQQKKAIVEEAWLKYYNQVLFEKGMITERERNLMINKIDDRTTRSLSRKSNRKRSGYSTDLLLFFLVLCII